jgi:LPS export ABC transporter protein LptC
LRTFYFVLGLSVLLLALTAGPACTQKGDGGPAANSPERFPIQEGWNSKIIISRAGLTQAVVRYGHMIKYEKTDVILFDQGIDVDFFDEQGMHSSHLISDRGEYNEKTEDVTGMGSVHVLSDSGMTLDTEMLHWDNARGRIYSDSLVIMTTADQDTLYGFGFESNADLTRRVIRRPWGKTKRHVDLQDIQDEFETTGGKDSTGTGKRIKE